MKTKVKTTKGVAPESQRDSQQRLARRTEQEPPAERTKDEARSGAGGGWFKGLPVLWLYRREYASFAGIVGTDRDGTLLAEAGEDVGGEQYVDVIATAKDLDPKIRRAIADKMIACWNLFAEGGAEPWANKSKRGTKSGACSPSDQSSQTRETRL